MESASPQAQTDLDYGLPDFLNIKKDAFLILTRKEKKHHYYYCCLYLDRLALRILKSQELQASWYESEGLESNENSSITWYIQPWVQRTRHPSFSPSSVRGNASCKLYAPISWSPLSSFSQEWEWRKMKVVTVIWMSSCHIPCAIKDLEQLIPGSIFMIWHAPSPPLWQIPLSFLLLSLISSLALALPIAILILRNYRKIGLQ